MLRTAVILTPAREGGRFRTAVSGQDPEAPVAPVAPVECHFWLEIETPIEVQRFDPQKHLYCRTFQKSDVQKHKVFDMLLSFRVQKHQENVTFRANVSKTVKKTVVFEGQPAILTQKIIRKRKKNNMFEEK